jgi:2-polyprenyl-3-methyl-5-hydroxy-6-metoxy-1,4-benzoquinol methylase
MNASDQTNRRCPVCAGEGKDLLFRQRFQAIAGARLLDGYDVVSCSDCGFCFADRIPEQARFDWYYQELSKYETASRAGEESPYDQKRFRQVAGIIKEWLPDRHTRILEIGCGTGGLLAILKNSGYTSLAGVDPSPRCAAAAAQLHGIPVTPATLSTLAPGADGYDTILLGGVLEHVRDLAAALDRLASLLNRNGRLFIAVPDASRYTHGEDAPFQEFSVEHINFFGPASLRNLMGQYRFNEVASRQEMMEVNHRTTTPVLMGLYEKGNVVRPLEPDTATAAELAAYVEISSRTDSAIGKTIDRLVSTGRPVIVWGTGAHTLRLLASTRLSEAKITAFVDSNPRYQGKRLNGAPIIAPSKLTSYPESPLLISSRPYQEEIAHSIRATLQLPNEIIRLYDLA